MKINLDNTPWDIAFEQVPRIKEPENRIANFAHNIWVLLDCPRRYWFDAVEPHFFEMDWELKATHGNYLHEMVIDYFKRSGMYRGDEVRGSNQRLNIQYRLDLLIEDHHNNVVPVEIKSANYRSYKFVEKNGPYPAHIYQLMVYLGCHGLESGMSVYPYGYILYYNKNDDKVMTFRVDFDVLVFSKIVDALLDHNEAVRTMTMPPRLEDEATCKKCPYYDRCYAMEVE